MHYGVIIEKGQNNYSAYVPDLPGCMSTGLTIDEVEENIKKAITFHIDGLKNDGLTVPTPTADYEHVETFQKIDDSTIFRNFNIQKSEKCR